MNPELQNLLNRWREGSLTTDEMRKLTAHLAKPEARAALRSDWFIDAALPQALAASSVILRAPQPRRHSVATSWRFSPAEWAALGAAAVICLGCVVWERIAEPPENTEVFAAQVAAAALEP